LHVQIQAEHMDRVLREALYKSIVKREEGTKGWRELLSDCVILSSLRQILLRCQNEESRDRRRVYHAREREREYRRTVEFQFSDYVNKLQSYKLLPVFILLAVQLCLTFFSVYNTLVTLYLQTRVLHNNGHIYNNCIICRYQDTLSILFSWLLSL
jgi:hypothetical protein